MAFKLPDVKFNMGLMTIQWTVCSVTFYLMFYMTNAFENVYWTAIGIGNADIIAYSFSRCLVTNIGPKRTLTYSWMLATIFGLLILTYGLQHQDSAVFPIFFFLARLGVSSAFGACFTGNALLFPASIVASTMSIC